MALSYAGAGGTVGSAIGSIIPGIGTAIGGAVGSVVGAVVDIFTGTKKAKKKAKKLKRLYAQEVQAFNQYADELNQMIGEQRGLAQKEIQAWKVGYSEMPQEYRKSLEREKALVFAGKF